MSAASGSPKDNLQGLPAAYAAGRASPLGRVTDAIDQERLLDLIGPPAGRHILDVGCGDGVLAVELASRGAIVTGVAASPDMIARAWKRARRDDEKKATFEVATAEDLPYAAGTFDVVVAITVLCFIEDGRTGLGEMARVLRPGGRLIVGDLGKWSMWAAKRRVQA